MKNEQLQKIIEDIPKFLDDDIQRSPPSTTLFLGRDADVYRGSFKVHKNVAIKVWRRAVSSSCPNFLDAGEAATMFKHSHHDNIVRFFGVLVDSQQDLKGVVTEYMPGGDLSEAIHNKTLSLSHGLRMHWIVQAGYALQYLHGKGIAHRDLKPQNMLLCGNLEKLKLCDFGLSKDYSTVWTTTAGGAGTYFYMAPERMDKTNYGKEQFPLAADIFSMSITIWEILTREYPAPLNITWHDLAENVLQGKRPDISRIQENEENKEIRDFIKRGWDGSPQDRPSIAELVALFEKEKTAANYDELSTTHSLMSPQASPQSTTSAYDRGMTARESLSTVSKYINSVLRGWTLVPPSFGSSLTELSRILDNVKQIGMIFTTSEEEEEMKKVEERREQLYAHIFEPYKSYCKKIMEEVWIARKLDKVKALEKEIRSSHNYLIDFIQQAEPTLLKCSEKDKKQIEKWYDEVVDFIKKRKEGYEDVSNFSDSCDELTKQAEVAYNFLRTEEYERLSEMIPKLTDNFIELDAKQKNDELQFMRYSNGQLYDRLERPRNVLDLIDERFKDLLKRYLTAVDGLSDELEQCTRLYQELSAQSTLKEGDIPLLAKEITNDFCRLAKQWKEVESNGERLRKMGLDINCDLNVDGKLRRIQWQLKKLDDSKFAITTVDEKLKKIGKVHVELPSYSIFERGPEDTKTKYQRVNRELQEMLISVDPSTAIIPLNAHFSTQLNNILKKKEKPLKEEIEQVLYLNDNVAKLFELSGWPK